MSLPEGRHPRQCISKLQEDHEGDTLASVRPTESGRVLLPRSALRGTALWKGGADQQWRSDIDYWSKA